MEETNKISNRECFFTTWKSAVGAGAYAMPYLFYEATPFIGFGIFALTVITTSYTSLLMIDAHDFILKVLNINGNYFKRKTIEIKEDTVILSYPDVAGVILGPIGYYLSFASMLIGLWGACTAYVIFLKQNLYTFTIENHNQFNIHEESIPLILFPLLATSLFFQNMQKLSIINILGLLSLGIVIVIVFVHCFEDDDVWHLKNIKNTFLRLPTFESLAIAFGISSFCMEGLMVASIQIYESMKKSNYSNYKKILIPSMVCFVVSYSIFAVLSCLQYSTPDSVILLNFDKYSLFYCIVAYFCCIQIFLTYIFVFFVLYVLCEQTAFGAYYMDNTVKQYIFRVILIVSTVGVAVFAPDYGPFLSLIGSLGNAALIFWVPSACYLVRHHRGFGIIWLNWFLCEKYKIPRTPNFGYVMLEAEHYLLDEENNTSKSHSLLKESNEEMEVSVFGKYIALTVLIIGILCSVVGVYVSLKSILEEI